MAEQKKSKNILKGCAIALLVTLVLLGAGLGIGWTFVNNEHREAASLPIQAIDFNRLKDGAYHGAYAGGMYQWRVNECDVTVKGGKVTEITLTASADPGTENAQAEMLYERVITAQSLQVDTISGSTLTSKAYLKAVEDALVKAQKE